MTVSIRELKNSLSEYIRRVRSGERVIVTDRGRPVAEISGVARKRLSLEDRLDRLAAAGELKRPRRKAPLADLPPLRVRGEAVSLTLLQDRD